MDIMTDSVTFYTKTMYDRAVRCAYCNRLIPSGDWVYGRKQGKSLSGRICTECHSKVLFDIVSYNRSH